MVGIDDHELTGLNGVTAAALLDTQKGPFTPEETPDSPTQAMVYEYLAACDIDPSDIQNVMSVFNVKNGTTSQNPQDNSKSTKGMSLSELTNLQIT